MDFGYTPEEADRASANAATGGQNFFSDEREQIRQILQLAAYFVATEDQWATLFNRLLTSEMSNVG